MITRTALVGVVLLVCSITLAQGQGKEKIQQYFNNAAITAKAAADPVEKREILNKSLGKMTKALDIVGDMGSTSAADKVGMQKLKASLIEKQSALAGTNGQVRIADEQLNAFANFIVQDIEQADSTVTISLVTLLLIIIIVILLF